MATSFQPMAPLFNPEMLGDNRAGGNQFVTPIYPRGSANVTSSGLAGKPIGDKSVAEPSSMKQQGVSSLRVRPLPDNHHEKMLPSTPMFLFNPVADVYNDVFTALPLNLLNFHLEDKARQNLEASQPAALTPDGKRRRDEDQYILSKYKHNDDFTAKFALTIEEFFNKISYHGLLGARMNLQSTAGFGFAENYFSGSQSGDIRYNFAVNGEVDMPNWWGDVKAGDEIGFFVGMCDIPNQTSFLNPDGAVISKNGTKVPYLQVISAWRREGQSPKASFRFNSRMDGDHTLNHWTLAEVAIKQLPVNVVDLTRPGGVRDVTNEDADVGSFKRVDFRANAKVVGAVQTSKFQQGVYIKIGNVILTTGAIPPEALIKEAHRSLNGLKQLAVRKYQVKVKVVPGGVLHKYKKK